LKKINTIADVYIKKPTEFLMNEKLVGSAFNFFAYFVINMLKILLKTIVTTIAIERVIATNNM